MLRQPAPVASQRCHWYVNEVGVAPLHEPLLAVSVLPSSEEPLIDGRAVATGAFVAAGRMMAVAADSREFVPAEFVAVTVTRSRWPTSSVTTT
jgi:hypothetical protein